MSEGESGVFEGANLRVSQGVSERVCIVRGCV